MHHDPMYILPASSPLALPEALRILRSGGTVLHATETCYGIACDLTNSTAVGRLFFLKHRPLTQPVSALFTTVMAAREYVEWSTEAQALADSSLPGPLTLILPLRTDGPKRLFATPDGTTTIGVRVSSHPLAHSIAEGFPFPLSTTSANLHGHTNTYDVASIIAQFQDSVMQPDLIIDSGELPNNPPSTIIDLTRGGAVLRP